MHPAASNRPIRLLCLALSLLAVACGKPAPPEEAIFSEIDAGNVEAVSRLLASGVTLIREPARA
jgi:hypothetical protein